MQSSIALILAKLRITGQSEKKSDYQISELEPLIQGWTKCNTDGAVKGNPGTAGCGDIFKNERTCVLGCFVLNLGTQNSLFVELTSVILAIGLTAKKNWNKLWLECDSELVAKHSETPLWFLEC
ncbi:putative ribonuclease H protein [Glycine soja]